MALLFNNQDYYPPAPTQDQQQRQGLLNPTLLQALSGFASGNTVGEQFGNVNAILSGQQKTEAEKQAQAAQINKTVQFLQEKDPELAMAVQSGTTTPENAWSAYIKKRQDAAEANKPKYQLQNINGRLVRVDMNSGQTDELGNYADPNANLTAGQKEFKAWMSDPSYAQWAQDQQKAKSKNTDFDERKRQASELGIGPTDPRYNSFVATGKFPREDQQPLTAVDKKAILDADELVQVNSQAIDALKQAKSLSSSANSGVMAGARAWAGANFPDVLVPDAISSPDSSVATQDYDNAIVGQALGQLKAIFGGAPTEGERKILLDLQGSSNMPKEVRDRVLDRAIEMAEKRLEFNKQRADSLRGGDFYKPSSEKNQSANSGTTKSGITFSVEP